MTTTTALAPPPGQPVILPPKCFDMLDEMVSTYGGVGAGRFYHFSARVDEYIPCCFIGFWEECFGSTREPFNLFGITPGKSDRAVYAINARKRPWHPAARVSWAEYCAEIGIRRGDEGDMTVLNKAYSCDEKAHDSSMGYGTRSDVQGMARQPLPRS